MEKFWNFLSDDGIRLHIISVGAKFFNRKGNRAVITFIYRPRSCNRVFVEKQHPGIKIVTWGNGCKHVVGGVMLSYGTACPGKDYWRGDAHIMAERIIDAIGGGIAWDEQGTVCLIVPLNRAALADKWMRKARHAQTGKNWCDFEDGLNESRLLLAGCGILINKENSIEFLGSMPPDPSVELILQPDNIYLIEVNGILSGFLTYGKYKKEIIVPEIESISCETVDA